MAGTDALAVALEGIDSLLAKQCDGEGVSVAELMEETGRGHSSVRAWLRREVQAGRWEMSGKRQTTTTDQRTSWTLVYRPVGKRKK